VAFIYETPAEGSLRQGELLAGVCEHRVNELPVDLPIKEEGADSEKRDGGVGADTIRHPLLLIITSWCDLLTDYRIRSDGADKSPNLLAYILTCPVYERIEIRSQFHNRRLFERAHENRDKRYFRIEASETPAGEEIPELYLDFRQIIPLPAAGLCRAVELGRIQRLALIPALYREEIIQRAFYYQSRVSLPA
jgi:hypothetical protein